MKIWCQLISHETYQILLKYHRLKISYEIMRSFFSNNHSNFKIIKNIEVVEGYDRLPLAKRLYKFDLLSCLKWNSFKNEYFSINIYTYYSLFFLTKIRFVWHNIKTLHGALIDFVTEYRKSILDFIGRYSVFETHVIVCCLKLILNNLKWKNLLVLVSVLFRLISSTMDFIISKAVVQERSS